MSQINEKILKAIQEDLPAATAGELKRFIEEANATKDKLSVVEKTLTDVTAQRDKLVQEKSTFDTASQKLAEADKKLTEVAEKQRQQALDFKDEQIKQRDFVINRFEQFLNNLVKNPRAIELTAESRMIPVWETYHGGGGCHTTRTEATTGQREFIETKE